MTQPSFFQRTIVLLYGTVAYAASVAAIAYAAGFVGNILVPKSIDSTPSSPLWSALLVDTALLLVFAVQHSVMARPFFKRRMRRLIPEAAERSTYGLASSLALATLFWFWQPLGGTLWEVSDPFSRPVLVVGSAFGWLLVLGSTVLINHFDLFGLRQVWLYFRNRPYTAVVFGTPGIYKRIRHPLYLGFFFAFWCTPVMTATHLFFAAMTTAYIFVGIFLEEQDLEEAHPEYAEYKRRTPMLIPRIGRQSTDQISSRPGDSVKPETT